MLPIITVLIIAAAIFFLKKWQKLPEKERKKRVIRLLIWGGALIVLALVVTGRAHWLMGVLATLLALAGRLAQFAQYIPLAKKLFGQTNDGNLNGQSPMATGNMSCQDAADILAINVDASADEIRLAHKKLMQKLHPDRGGSDALASQINLAKEVLLKDKTK